MNPEPGPAYLPYQPPPPPPPPDPGRRRLLIGLSAGWALVLLVGAVWYALHGRPSVREQTTVAQAQATVDRVIGEVVAAAGPGTVPAVSGYDQVESCDVTPVRTGARYDREAWLATGPGTERALLDRIAGALPPGYRPELAGSSASASPKLLADAGDYVAVTGTVDRPGLVLVSASTGCRPLGNRPAADPTGTPAVADRTAVDGALAAFGITPVSWSTHRLPCGLTTVEADGAARPAGPLPSPLPSASGSASAGGVPPVVRADDVYAQPPGLLVRLDGDRPVVTVTTGRCG
jgi:hypothetical protein